MGLKAGMTSTLERLDELLLDLAVPQEQAWTEGAPSRAEWRSAWAFALGRHWPPDFTGEPNPPAASSARSPSRQTAQFPCIPLSVPVQMK